MISYTIKEADGYIIVVDSISLSRFMTLVHVIDTSILEVTRITHCNISHTGTVEVSKRFTGAPDYFREVMEYIFQGVEVDG